MAGPEKQVPVGINNHIGGVPQIFVLFTFMSFMKECLRYQSKNQTTLLGPCKVNKNHRNH